MNKNQDDLKRDQETERLILSVTSLANRYELKLGVYNGGSGLIDDARQQVKDARKTLDARHTALVLPKVV